MACKDLVIIGAGGFGREVLWQLQELDQYNIFGFIDDNPSLQGQQVNNTPVLGDNQWLLRYPKNINAVICVANPEIRKAIYNELKNNCFISFPNIIAKDVRYSDFVKFGQGCIICLSTTITVNITLGDFVIINPHCAIGHDAVLDDFATLYYDVNVAGRVHIKSCTEIGTGTNIIQGKTIGENVIVGAGSVVVKDIPANCTAVGSPAKPIKFHG